jgi:hypothetical protein
MLKWQYVGQHIKVDSIPKDIPRKIFIKILKNIMPNKTPKNIIIFCSFNLKKGPTLTEAVC